MPNYSRSEVVLVRYPFSDLAGSKVRPAVVVNSAHKSQDLLLVALTSKTQSLLEGEFVLKDWAVAGLNIETALKRGIFTIHEKLVVRSVGLLSISDAYDTDKSLRNWLSL